MGLFGLFRRKIVVSEEELLFWEGLRAYQAKDYTRALPIFEQAATKDIRRHSSIVVRFTGL